LIFDTGQERLRVQCKWASRCGEVIIVRMYGAGRSRAGLLRSFYGPEEVDAFAAYCVDTARCYFTTIAESAGRSQLLLRLDPTRNNQQSGVNWAKDFEFAAKLGALPGP
jgi:PD-(D/E)XK endonuclease